MLLSSTSTLKIVCRAGNTTILPGRNVDSLAMGAQNPVSRIRETLINKVELSASSYDTAWVAMVPSRNQSDKPCFPESLRWIMENQQPDGSWGLDPSHPLLIKDSLSSTLACVLALQKWNVGEQLVLKGLDFIVKNIWTMADKHQYSPIGFDIIFPSMIEQARGMGLNLQLDPSSIDGMLLNRDLGLESLKGKTSHLAYVAEGLTRLQDWQEVMRHQRSNGSLFNSPSTTASAFTRLGDEKCFQYLDSVLKRNNNAVPTVYPLDISTRLGLIDTLERLGIDRYFKKETKRVLDDIYRSWMEGSEELFADVNCLAMAFRLLRMNGYDVSSATLGDFGKQECFLRFASGDSTDTKAVLELYKASLITIFQTEPVLDRIHSWTRTYLNEQLLNGEIPDNNLSTEVDYFLTHPQARLERIENRTYIENYDIDKVTILKSSYRAVNIDNRDLLTFSFQDFNKCQAMHQRELEQLERWVKKYNMENLKFARQKIKYVYFAIASVLPDPELSDARISWSQNSVLTTIVDDFFDIGGSIEEMQNLIELVKRWDEHSTVGFLSEKVEILFSAVYETVNELAARAALHQGRNVRSHMIRIWIDVVMTMFKEAEWKRDKTVTTLDEYMANGYVSFALEPIVLITVYFLGETLSDEVIASEECGNLFRHMSIIGRLLNDYRTFEKEGVEGKLNSLSLLLILSDGAMTEEEARREIRGLIESSRRELLRLVLQSKGSVVPRACKNLFWMMSKICHLFYMDSDGYTSVTRMISYMTAVLKEPIILPPYSS